MRALVVHGGAGAGPTLSRADQQRACEDALELGWQVLAEGGTALDAVTRAVVRLEDDPALNAGYGACLTDLGTVELDASIMEGRMRAAGAVAVIRRLRHPILLARLLMEKGPHLFMVGSEAEAVAAAHGLALVNPATLIAPERLRAWQAHAESPRAAEGTIAAVARNEESTVGAVALDDHGHVAAATSTGGIAMKRAGRVGDSAVIGAGTFADDRAGAASSTGHGETIMRAALAQSALWHMRWGLEPERAARAALAEVTTLGASAGIILVDRHGRVAAVHTTPHMVAYSRRS